MREKEFLLCILYKVDSFLFNIYWLIIWIIVLIIRLICFLLIIGYIGKDKICWFRVLLLGKFFFL